MNKVLAALTLFLSFALSGHGATFGDFTYQTAKSQVSITGYSGLGGAVTIPDKINGYPVTGIGQAFYNCTGLTSVTIPNSVTSIVTSAFHNCTGLTSLRIPSSVTSIGYMAFQGCTGLTNVTIPNSVTSIGYLAFEGCSGLTSVTIPNSVTSIGYSAFQGCAGLMSVTIPNSVTSIGNGAFYNCTGLTNVTIPNSVTSIGYAAFQGCAGLMSVTIPNSVTSIRDWMFYNCTGLTNVTIPNSVTSIGSSAFHGCAGLMSVTIPNSVTEISFNAFGLCTGLMSVTIPNSVTSIQPLAFQGCTGLTSVTIPDSVTSIGISGFSGCSGLTSMTIGSGVTSIGGQAFWGCTGLTNLSIPDSVTNIGDEAFYNCTGLTNVTIPNSVTSIGNGAFRNCTGLTSVTIGSGVISWNQAFYGCTSLMSVTIGSGVTSIGWQAFWGCTGLTNLSIPDSVTSIGDEAFYNCTGLTNVTIPNSVTSIGYSAFQGCAGLMSVTIPSGVAGIEAYAPWGSSAEIIRFNPLIALQPSSATVKPGDDTNFSVTAAGNDTLSYQWQKNGVDIAGETQKTLSLGNVQSANAGSYAVVIRNTLNGAVNSVISRASILAVVVVPVISSQPSSETVAAGQSASLRVTATGNGTLSYQWQKDGVNVAGGTRATLSLSNVQVADAGSYAVVVSNTINGVANTLTSSDATFTVVSTPAISTQPANSTLNVGQSTSFSISATGNDTLSYQWQKGGVDIAGATQTTLSLGNVQSADAGSYAVVIRNTLNGVVNSVTSSAAALTVVEVPVISSQPSSGIVAAGQNVSLSVSATGNGTLSYQWQKGGVGIAGETQRTLSLGNVQSADAGNYAVVIRNTLNGVVNSATSSAATLTVVAVPVISSQPSSVTVAAGQSASLSVNATGNGSLSYQWQKDGVNVAGGTQATLSLSNMQVASAGSYTVVVSNAINGVVNTLTSRAATFTVVSTPAISAQPANATVNVGQSASFSISATGNGTLSYQWQKGGVDIAGETLATLSLGNVQAADAGSYAVVIRNTLNGVVNTATSSAATLTVVTVPVISSQPSSVTVAAGQSASLIVSATGNGTLSYQWQKDGVNVAGGTQATLSLSNVQVATAGSYVVFVSNRINGVANTLTSRVVTLSVISTQPVNSTVNVGQSASFSVSAVGGTLSYQWQRGGVNIAGATQATLSLGNVQSADAGSYAVVIRNTLNGVVNSATSSAATLTVVALPVISSQPSSVTVAAGQSTSLSVSATGNGTLSYQWQKDGVNVAGGTQSTLSLSNVQLASAGSYTVVVTNTINGVANKLTSRAATFTVVSTPAISAQPAKATLNVGQSASFSITATGNGTLSYQWQKGGVDIAGATLATLSLGNVQTADAGSYAVVIRNTLNGVVNSASSSAATLTVVVKPTITSQPTSLVLNPGQGASFSVAATGSAASYQWRKNGANIAGATGATLAFKNINASDAASYTAVATNAAGSVTSGAAVLTVNAATYGLLRAAAGPQTLVFDTYQYAPVILTVSAADLVGFANPKFRWSKGGNSLVGQTGASLIISDPDATDAGVYSVTIAGDHSKTSILSIALKAAPVVTPSITRVDQISAVVGQTINIRGQGFTHTTAVTINDTAVAFQFINDSWIVARVPMDAAQGLVRVWKGEIASTSGSVLKKNPLVNFAIQSYGDNQYGQKVTPNFVGKSLYGLVSGANHNLALLNNSISIWGSMDNSDIPKTSYQNFALVPNESVVKASAGSDFTVVLQKNGIAAAWGYNSSGQATVTKDLPTGASVAAGNYHAFLLSTSGTIYGWGNNNYGQQPKSNYSLVLKDPEPKTEDKFAETLINVIAVQGADQFSAALRSDGGLYAWGTNVDGQTNNDPLIKDPPFLRQKRLIQFALGKSHALGLRRDGTVVAWGSNVNGQCDVPAGLNRVVALAAGNYHSLALKDDGTVVAWGQIINAVTSVLERCVVPVDKNQRIVGIASGLNHFLLLTDQSMAGVAVPVVTAAPASATVNQGGSVTFSVTATGALAYQWSKAGVKIPGATRASLTLTQVQPAAAANYTVTMTNAGGSFTSTAAMLTVIVPPSIAVQPITQTLDLGGTYVLAVTTAGSAASYQWYKGGVAIHGASDARLNLSEVVATHAGDYKVEVKNAAGTVTSNPAKISVSLTLATPAITSQPAGKNVIRGQNTTLAVVARGLGLNYQWKKDGVSISGATSSTLSLYSIQAAHAGNYSVTVSNSGGSATSAVAVLATTLQPAVAAGPDYSLYLDSKGTVWAVGDNDSGQLADGSSDNVLSNPQPVISGVQMIAAGDSHSLFLKNDGSVWASGDNWAGQLGDGTYVNKFTPVQVMTGVKAISAGDTHSLFLKMDGTVWATGANSRGQLGVGKPGAAFYATANPVQVMSGVQAISAGKGYPDGHSIFLKTDGSVWATGANGDGQLGNGSNQDQYSPVSIMSGVKAIAAGENYSVFLKTDGSVWATGLNANGQLSDGTFISKSKPAQVMTGVKAISAGYSVSLFLKTDGKVYASGQYVGGESSDGLWQSSSTPIFLMQDVKAISAGESHFLFIKTDASVWAVGSNEEARLGDGNYFIATPTQVMTNVKAIAPGASSHSMFLKTDGSAWAVGNNYNGELGDGTHKSRSNPVQVMTDVKAIALGDEHSLLLKTDGSVWATGRNDSGQLGDLTFTDKSSFAQIMTNVKAIAAGVEHSLFLKNDGTVWATGYNGEGQLGNSTYQNRAAPVQVISGVTAIASGDRKSFFLKSNGDLWGTGLNDEGQLGDGTAITKSTPFKLMSGVKALAAAHGGDHSLILKTDGSVWATGRNSSGQLGDGTWVQKNTWVQIMTGVKAMAQSSNHSLFLKTDNTVWATGSNSSGQLGNGSTVDQNVPVQVMSNVQAMGCGEYYSLFLKTDGTVWATGSQYDGILGNGAGLPSLNPVRAFTVALSALTNASLSGLIISSGTLNRPFDSAITSYTASVANTVSSLTLRPTVSFSLATVKVNGKTVVSGSISSVIPLTVGSNSILVMVTAHDGTTTKTYTLNVTRLP